VTGTSIPTVSVVMGVYNGADAVVSSLESVFDQENCDFEVIAVDDGSTDGSGRMLDELATREKRLTVVHQSNAGLTRALVRGCSMARGEFIARQDCGDVSLPGRFAVQVRHLRSVPEAVAVTCHTAFVGPRDEPLYVAKISEAVLAAGLTAADGQPCRGPSHHGSVMMRRDTYEAAGGYRPEFYFAQDLDLWTRMVEIGQFAVVDDVLYRARLEPQSLSGMQSREQEELALLITQATLARRSGQPDTESVRCASAIRPVKRGGRAHRIAAGNYFIGCCLRRTNPLAAAEYFRQAVRDNPWHWKARARWLQARLTSP